MRWIIQSRPRVANSAYFPWVRSPWNTATTLRSSYSSGSYVPWSQMNIEPAP